MELTWVEKTRSEDKIKLKFDKCKTCEDHI